MHNFITPGFFAVFTGAEPRMGFGDGVFTFLGTLPSGHLVTAVSRTYSPSTLYNSCICCESIRSGSHRIMLRMNHRPTG